VARWVFGSAVLAACVGGAYAEQVFVIELHNRTAEELLPVIYPLTPRGGWMNGRGYQIFVGMPDGASTEALMSAVQRADQPSANPPPTGGGPDRNGTSR